MSFSKTFPRTFFVASLCCFTNFGFGSIIPLPRNVTVRSKPPHWGVAPEDFVKLKLRDAELRGSRWTLEQDKAVHVYHSVEIVDATLFNRDELTLR